MTTPIDSRPAVRSEGPRAEAPSGRVALALARIEGRRLLRSPALLVGVGLAALQTGPGGLWPEAANLRLRAMDGAFLVLPLAAATLIASFLAALRARRSGAEEVFSATPAPPRARTAAHLLAPLPVAAVGVMLVATALLAAWRLRHGFGRPDLAEVAVGPTLVLGAGALGVLLARWTRSTLAAIVACLGIAALELTVAALPQTNPFRRLAFWYGYGDMPAELLPDRLARWHLAYLAGLVAMAAVGALARHGLRRRLVVAGLVAIALVATSAWFQARPIPASLWASRNAVLLRPHEFQECEERHGIRYCAYPSYRPLIDLWAAPIAGVHRAVPSGRWPVVEVSQRVAGNDRQWVSSRDVERKLPALPPKGARTVDDGHLHPPVLWDTTGRAELGLALLASSRAVGLPLGNPDPDARCDASGQARAVVALWLAGQATPATGRTLRQIAKDAVVDIGGHTILVIPDFGTPGGVAFGATEMALALELLGRPSDEVAAMVDAAWAELTDRGTPVATAVSRLGLADPGPTPLGPGRAKLDVFSALNGHPVPEIGQVCR
ncbi:MAG: hypothetical protein ACR2KK_01335 [Acidimicrobiales bacterium]